MCDVISAFPAVQSDSRSVIVALNIAHQSMNAVLVHLLHLCIVLPFSLQLLLDVLSHVCYSIFNWFLYRFNRLQKKKRSLSASSVSATPSRTSFRQVGQTPPWKIPALCLILKKDLAIYFQMLHWCLECFKTSVKNGCWLCWHNATATITTLKPVHAESVHLFIIFSSLISFLHTWIYFSFPFHSTLKPKDTPRDPVLMLLCWDNIRWCFFSVVADGWI